MELQASRSEALNNKLACCWRSFSFSPQPQEWPLKPWTPGFLHPAEAPAAIFNKNAPKPRCAVPRAPPPPGGGVSVLRGAKNATEIRLGRPRARPKFLFFAPGGLQERSWTRLGAILAPLKPQVAAGTLPRAIWERKMMPRRPPGPSKIIVFLWANYSFAKNKRFSTASWQKSSQMLPGRLSGSLWGSPGAPREACKRSIFRAKRPPGGTQ